MTGSFAAIVGLLAAGAPPAQPTTAPPALPAGNGTAWRAAMLGAPAAGSPGREPPRAVEMERPVVAGWLSSRFGERVDPLGGGRRAHRGVDIAAPLGTPVVAASDGVVVFVGTAGGYGNLVRIDHPSGFQTSYGHLSRILAHGGETVRRGDVIGMVGSTGHSTGSHLHFEIRVAGSAVDPQRPLPGSPEPAMLTAPAAAPAALRWQGMAMSAERLPAAYR